MKFGLLYEIEPTRGGGAGAAHAALWSAIEQVKLAESLGFDCVWSVEQCFGDPLRVASAPEIWLAAVAQHTERIRIGHGVRVLPFKYMHPVRVAEMAAVLDIMSRGRFELGTGLFPSADELAELGVDAGELQAQWDEALRMLPAMWSDDEFSWSSDHFTMPARSVFPKPMQDPHPPIWMAGADAEAATRAGALGLGFMHLAPGAPGALAGEISAYRAASSDGAHGPFAVATPLLCGGASADAGASDADAESAIVGSPEQCGERVEAYCSQGVDVLLGIVRPGTRSHELECDSLQRFGEHVMPRFRD